MNLTIANVTTSVVDASFAAAVAAISKQVTRDFQPEWLTNATVTGTRLDLATGKASVDTPTDAVIYLGDSSQDPTTGVSGAFGYHSANYGHIPYGFVYLDVCAQYDEPWSCTLSHETLELLADPTAVLAVAGPDPRPNAAADATVNYDLEVCDPTQSDTYTIDGVTVSNFVTRAYFRMVGVSKTTNFLNLALAPFGVRPQGYFQYEDGSGAYQVDGQRVGAKRLAARAMLKDFRRAKRRADRLAARLKGKP